MRPSLSSQAAIVAVLVFAVHCGGTYGGSGTPSTGGVPAGGGQQPTGGPIGTTAAPTNVLTISNLAFSPLSMQVAPGAVVTVRNLDGMPHSVTSEASPSAFRPAAVAGIQFDTGAFTGEASFTIPAGAAVGTVIPYYCRVHTSTMATPNGQIEVVAAAPSAQPTPAPTPAMPSTGY